MPDTQIKPVWLKPGGFGKLKTHVKNPKLSYEDFLEKTFSQNQNTINPNLLKIPRKLNNHINAISTYNNLDTSSETPEKQKTRNTKV